MAIEYSLRIGKIVPESLLIQELEFWCISI